MPRAISAFRHWFPILTICPVNGMPDFIYVSIEWEAPTETAFLDLYLVRKLVRRTLSMRRISMEAASRLVLVAFYQQFRSVPSAITVSLMFNRHVTYLYP